MIPSPTETVLNSLFNFHDGVTNDDRVSSLRRGGTFNMVLGLFIFPLYTQP